MWLQVIDSPVWSMVSVSVGHCKAEEPNPFASDQTVHRSTPSTRPLLSHRTKLQTEVLAEKGITLDNVIIYSFSQSGLKIGFGDLGILVMFYLWFIVPVVQWFSTFYPLYYLTIFFHLLSTTIFDSHSFVFHNVFYLNLFGHLFFVDYKKKN